MSKTIPPPPKPQEPKIANEGKISRFCIISSIKRLLGIKEKEIPEVKNDETELHPKVKDAFIAEYEKIINKTSTLSRKQRDYVIAKVESLNKSE